jgi:amino-acid N-acetyltransferase
MRHVDGIFQLVTRMAGQGMMLPRSKYQIIINLANYIIAADADGKAVGVGGFFPLWTDLGEVRSLAVDEEYRGMGVGRLLVRALLDEGRRLEVPEVFALTYQTEFFGKMGFTVTDKDRFPRKIWRECLECPKLEACDETAMHLLLDGNGRTARAS